MAKDPYSDDLSKLFALLPEPVRGLSLKKAQRKHALVMARNGGDCPCCGQFGHVNGYSPTRGMVNTLLWICKKGGLRRKWVDVQKDAPTWVLKSRQSSQLAYWKLVVKKSSTDPKKKGSGKWRITKLGMAFLKDGKGIPKKVFVYKKTKVDYSKEKVYITDIYEDFDIRKVMNTNWLDTIRKNNR